jgi:hypothetical protein
MNDKEDFKMKIKAYVSCDEHNDKHFYRLFEVIDKLPNKGDEYDYHFGDGIKEVVKEVISENLDCEQGNDEVYNYQFYRIVTDWFEDDEHEEKSYFVAKRKTEIKKQI